MACPVCVSGGPFLVVTGLWSVLFQDKKYRRLWWLIVYVLIAGWAAYVWLADGALFLRILLEIFSTGFLLGLGARLLYLVRVKGMRPFGWTTIGRWEEKLRPYTMSRVTIALKSVLLAMIVFEWAGRADFDFWWYGGAAALLVLWMLLIWIWRKAFAAKFTRPCSGNFIPAEKLTSADEAASSCPFGFGSKN